MASQGISKRAFIQKSCLAAGTAVLAPGMLRSLPSGTVSGEKLWKWSKEAMYYAQTPRGAKCLLCPAECTLRDGETGICRNRVNVGDKLYSIVYGNPCSVYVDPIEKKPLFHFQPSSWSFSIATAGCNMACLNCQNWTISQVGPKETRNQDLMPEAVVKESLANNCKSISYTYSEPITFYEYVYDTSRLAHDNRLQNVFISNGYISEEPLKALCRYIDAANINLKSFSDAIYMKLNGGKLQPVLDTLKTIRDSGTWLEITNLVVPGWTDDMEMIKKMCGWLLENGFQDTPLHFLRFQPLYKLNHLPPTPAVMLESARDTAMKEGIHYVYIGNVPGSKGQNTYCPDCHKEVITRNGFRIDAMHITNGKCSYCGTAIKGKWS